MPKRGHSFTCQLSFGVFPDLRQKLIALGYLTGVAGQYAVPARNLLEQAVAARIAGMTPEERARYDEILGNVKIQDQAGVLP